MAVPQSAPLDIDSEWSQAFSVKSCLAMLLIPGSGCGYSSGRVPPRATALGVLGEHSCRWAAPEEQGRQPQRGGYSSWAEQGQLVASRGWCCLMLDPAKPFLPHREPWKLDFVFFPSQVTRNHLTFPQDQKGSSNLLEHRDVVR